jgi:hypothetical protein
MGPSFMALRSASALVLLPLMLFGGKAAAQTLPGVVPAPRAVHERACTMQPSLARFPRIASALDPGGLEVLRARWGALGVPLPTLSGTGLALEARRTAGPREHYRLAITAGAISIEASDAEGEFDALATLAQLPGRANKGWTLPCVTIDDAPAMRWRIVSDDVSRGPLPTMSYFKERIRTLAAFKVNGYSPYMEQVFADPRAPFVAPPEPITAAELRELDRYARLFHVALIPEQQTFAHMHETLKWEQFAPLAELPHGYLLAPGDPGRLAYLTPL